MRKLKDRAGREVARFVRVPPLGEVCFDGKRHKQHCGEEVGMHGYISKPIRTGPRVMAGAKSHNELLSKTRSDAVHKADTRFFD